MQSIFIKAAKLHYELFFEDTQLLENEYGPLKCICHTLFIIVTIRDKEILLDEILGSNNKGILFFISGKSFSKSPEEFVGLILYL